MHTRKIFAGEDDTEDPYAHIDYFTDICETFKLNAFTHDDMKLKLFSQTLSKKALTWYKALSTESKSTWKNLSSAFLSHFYPRSKTDGARRVITYFKNRPGESLVRGYIRYRGLIDRCPHHGLPDWYVLYTFYGELNDTNRNEVDLASGGTFMDFTISQAWKMLDKIHHNRETWSFDIGDEGGLKIEHDCIKAFVAT